MTFTTTDDIHLGCCQQRRPQSYDVQTETGILRRTRRHLLRIPQDKREKRKEDKDEVFGSTQSYKREKPL